MLIAIGLFSLGWLLGALAIWLSRPGEAAQRASFQINSGTRGLVAQDHAPNEKPGGLIYIPLEAGEDQPPEKDIRDNRAPRGSGLALPRKVALERDRKQFIEPNRTLPLADPVMLPSPPEIPPKLAFAAAMWGIDSDLAARAIIAAPQVSKRPGRFKSAVRAVFAPPRPGAKHELNSTKQ
jgi:hypothetical protein